MNIIFYNAKFLLQFYFSEYNFFFPVLSSWFIQIKFKYYVKYFFSPKTDLTELRNITYKDEK